VRLWPGLAGALNDDMNAFPWIALTACLGSLGTSCTPSAAPAPEGLAASALEPSTEVAPHRFCGWLHGAESPAVAEEAYETFAARAGELDAVHPRWWRVDSPTTFANHAEDSSTPFFGFHDPRVLRHTTPGGGRTLLMPMIGANTRHESLQVHRMINDPELRGRHVEALVALVADNAYDGIDLDYEHIDPLHLEHDFAPGQDGETEREAFSAFVAEAAGALHAAGKALSLAVPVRIDPPDPVFDYDALSRAADVLHVMAYDYHYEGGPHAGPLAPLGWVEAGIADILSVDGGRRRLKFVLGLANYGILGPEVGAGGDGFTRVCEPATARLELASDGYETTTAHMDQCDQGKYAYPPGRTPNKALPGGDRLFFEDLASFEEKVAASARAGLGGITYWGIGGEPVGPSGRTFFEMVRQHFPRR
jgi:spore germination protein YaaH